MIKCCNKYPSIACGYYSFYVYCPKCGKKGPEIDRRDPKNQFRIIVSKDEADRKARKAWNGMIMSELSVK